MVAIALSTAISALALFANSVNALPTWVNNNIGAYQPAKDLKVLLLPASDLAAPTSTLKFVLLGLGTQNYSCAGVATDAPASLGAKADLYDLGSPLSKDRDAKNTIQTLSPLALSWLKNPATLKQNLQSRGYDHLVGHHFFQKVDRLAGANTPIFALDTLATVDYPLLQVNVKTSTPAPAGSAEGSVPWLRLQDTMGLSKGQIDTVYRVETAGGSAPTTCQGRLNTKFEVMYAAQYWIYGPA